MSSIANSVLELIGKTPLVRINAFNNECQATILGKCEFMNPSSSVKDRAAYSMIIDAENKGLLKKGTTIIEPTSGNTGIGLAMVATVKNYSLILTMPESMTIERRSLLKSFGAKIILTPAHLGMLGAIKKAEELKKDLPDAIILQQFSNPANPLIHEQTTAKEIWTDTDGKIDIFIAGVGTGGTLAGVSRSLKKIKPSLECIAVEPESSAVISGCEAGPHMIQGIGAGFVPDNFSSAEIDRVIPVKDTDAIETVQRLIKHDGLLVGISSGANIFAAVQEAKKDCNVGKIIVTILCDTGERYLSTSLFNTERSK